MPVVPDVELSGSGKRHSGTGQELQMDVSKILEELRQEREQLEEAILSLERLARGRGRRRGRPPSWMVEAKKRGRPAGSKNKTVAQPKASASAAA
jgi:hypothetical protein